MRRAAIFVALVVLAWLIWDTGADPVRLARGVPWVLDFLRRMLPPDLAVLPAAVSGAILTVEIALLGTSVAAVLALPLGFLSARNVAPAVVFYPARTVLNLFRSIDTLVYALVFVAAVGLGPFPGVLAVVAYTTTSLAKLYSEAIEGIEPGPVDAITATGATRLQILRFGGAPAVPVVRAVPAGDEHPGGDRARLRRRRRDRLLPADLPAHDRLSSRLHGAAGDDRDGGGGRHAQLAPARATRVSLVPPFTRGGHVRLTPARPLLV
jgi:phosphonate transport system permease protein